MQCQLWIEHEPTQVTAKLATARGKLKSVGEPREASEGFGFLVFAESAAERILWSCWRRRERNGQIELEESMSGGINCHFGCGRRIPHDPFALLHPLAAHRPIDVPTLVRHSQQGVAEVTCARPKRIASR